MNGICRIPEVWDKNRNEIFANRLGADIERLQLAGFSNKEIKKMIGTFDYVRFWTAWPQWAFPADKLPKGYKWSDGVKYVKKSGKRSIGQSYVFLPAGNDLYINGKPQLGLVGTNVHDKAFLRVINFRMLTAIEFLEEFGDRDPFFNDCVLKYWHKQGGRIGYVESLYGRPRNPQEASLMWDIRKKRHDMVSK